MYSDKLTVHQASKFLGVSRTTMINWHKNGKLVPQVHPITKIRYYCLEDLKKFLVDQGLALHCRCKRD